MKTGDKGNRRDMGPTGRSNENVVRPKLKRPVHGGAEATRNDLPKQEASERDFVTTSGDVKPLKYRRRRALRPKRKGWGAPRDPRTITEAGLDQGLRQAKQAAELIMTYRSTVKRRFRCLSNTSVVSWGETKKPFRS